MWNGNFPELIYEFINGIQIDGLSYISHQYREVETVNIEALSLLSHMHDGTTTFRLLSPALSTPEALSEMVFQYKMDSNTLVRLTETSSLPR